MPHPGYPAGMSCGPHLKNLPQCCGFTSMSHACFARPGWKGTVHSLRAHITELWNVDETS